MVRFARGKPTGPYWVQIFSWRSNVTIRGNFLPLPFAGPGRRNPPIKSRELRFDLFSHGLKSTIQVVLYDKPRRREQN